MNKWEATNLALLHMGKWGLLDKGWTLTFTKAYRMLGQCRHDTKEIVLSEKWLPAPVEEITDTILHEIAHAITGMGHGHDLKWRGNCLKVGANPNRLHDSTIPGTFNPMKFKHHCKNCNKVFYRVRKPHLTYNCCLKEPEGPSDEFTIVTPGDWELNPNYVR